jgi:high-affinity Fe2+/Pb2+ permease
MVLFLKEDRPSQIQINAYLLALAAVIILMLPRLPNA